MVDINLLVGNYFDFLQTPLGVLAFISFYAIWVIFLLPGLWPSMLGGFMYGSIFGSLFVFLGAFLGAEITFLLGRTLLSNWAQKRISQLPKIKAVEKAIIKEGLKLVVLTRLSPVFPFSLMNLFYALSNISFRDFSIGLIAILPGTILYCTLGSLAGEIANFNMIVKDRNDINSILFSLLGIFSTFAVVWIISQSARKALKDIDHQL